MAEHGQVAEANAGMAQAWDGKEGAVWAARAEDFDRTARFYQPLLVAAAGAGPEDRVVDVGCGSGRLSLDLAAWAASVLGVDLSGPMLEVARRRAVEEGRPNATFVHGDAQVHPFEASSYDLVVSRSGSMFFADPVAAFTNLARALRPRGRMVLSVWRGMAESEWLRTIIGTLAAGRDMPGPPENAPGPFGLSDPSRVHDILGAAGFTDVALDDVRQPLDFGATADAAVEFVLGSQGGWMLEGLDDTARNRAIADLRSVMADHATPDGVLLGSATWFVSAHRP